MALTNGDVVKRFAERRKGNGRNVSTDGEHFRSYNAVIAQWLSTEDNLKDHTAVVLLNGDRLSITTSIHQSSVRSGLANGYDYPTVSFSALYGPGLACNRGWGQGGLVPGVQLVDYEKDIHEIAYEGGPEYETILKDVPIGATTFDIAGKFVSRSWHEDGGWQERAYRGYHRAGTVVLRYRDYDYLCGFDEGSYFVSRLPERVSNVNEAYAALMPREVQGKNFLRQGEWFFTPIDLKDFFPLFPISFTGFKKTSVNEPLPRDAGSNPHTVTYLHNLTSGRILAAGTVRHPQHRMLKLEKKTVYEAFRNRSLGDWSAQARVD